jgi:hypothetical protein
MRLALRGAVLAALFHAFVPPATAHEALLQPLVPTIVEYRWRLLAPHWSVDPRVLHAPASLEWRSRPVRYALPDFEFVRRKIGAVPVFECKYADFWLPNACTTHWQDVYVEVAVPVLQRETFDVDVPYWRQPGDAFVVDVPRLEWKEETLVVSLPALAVQDRDALSP